MKYLPVRLLLTAVLVSVPILGQTLTINTDKGAVVGRQAGVRTFLGIPYAAPPVGALRWKAPQPAAAWSQPHDAGVAGNVCPQVVLALFPVPGMAPGQMLGSEDCLNLNVFAPTAAAPAAGWPVLVWLHGGSFTVGAGSLYDGSVLAEKYRLVVVTINYRLGALGFLALKSLDREQGSASGNYGLMDQQAALQWVQKNIGAFGGDVANVTIAGESAGGMSVCALVASPLSAGLFHKGIIQSGLCMSPGNSVTGLEAGERNEKYVSKLGCSVNDLACLRAVQPALLLKTAVPGRRPLSNQVWSPVYATPVLPLTLKAAFEQGRFNRVPLLAGTNHDEGRLFISVASPTGKPVTLIQYWGGTGLLTGALKSRRVLTEYPFRTYGTPALAFSTMFTDAVFSCPAETMNTAVSSFVPVYAFEFHDPKAVTKLTVPADLPGLGSFHSSSLVYAFQSPIAGLADPAQFDAAQAKLSDAFSQAWANFARNGNPNVEGKSAWRSFDAARKNVQVFTPAGVQESTGYSSDHKCAFWTRTALP